MNESYRKLCYLLEALDAPLFIALSGGIDSLTLMTVAARVRSRSTIAMHAVSAAVPAEATGRCQTLAKQHHWQLREIDALEFHDVNYVRNPINRCYYCKQSLFIAIEACNAASEDSVIATGTNIDDLGDFRPGLTAAKEHQVWQPYVEAGINKRSIRAIARQEGLAELSELPAAPCLSSRVETGISINANDLKLIHRVEKLVLKMTEPGNIRCRLFKHGVVVQVPSQSPVFSSSELQEEVSHAVQLLCQQSGKPFAGLEAYVRGSAFIQPDPVQRDGH